jgi:5-methylcytosine-specific restriction protein B
MSVPTLEPRLLEDLKTRIARGIASGDLLSDSQIRQQLDAFQQRFGADMLRGLDGEPLLRLMHGRSDPEARCLAYWLEFPKDDAFDTYRFGSIAGGSAFKFGVFQRKADGAWVINADGGIRIVSTSEAVEIARQQRTELLAGTEVLNALKASDTSDETYLRLQAAMEHAAPTLSGAGWAHKYWYLLHSDRLDDYHSPSYQRFHLFKLLQMPPDALGIGNAKARFVCAGRLTAVAKQLEVPFASLARVLNQRNPFHRYWRVGTTSGSTGASYWHEMRDGGFVSIGWKDHLKNLSDVLSLDAAEAREAIRTRLLPMYEDKPAVVSRKAGEVFNFVSEIAENDLVLACDGQDVLGIGRVVGPYEYDDQLQFPNKRPVEWQSVEKWKMPEAEGLRTTVFRLGNKAKNLLEIERRLFNKEPQVAEPTVNPTSPSSVQRLQPLEPTAARIDNILRRKGQVILYGPPGTGKTFHALAVAKELAARQAFRKPFRELSATELNEIEGDNGLVRVCTFHPGYGYEDFVEGLRPTLSNGQMVFAPRDGHFKKLCTDARQMRDRHYFLVVDEINRGDVPRIFGELLTLIELNKRETHVVLPVTGTSFSVPPNVYLIGTMNTADRSISMLDAALRRRFGFIELMPDSSVLRDQKAGTLQLGPWLDALNTRLRLHLKRDARNLQIGHAYLMPRQPIKSVAEFGRILRDEIIPLLEEYCYDDFQTLGDILGKSLVSPDQGRIREELFLSSAEEALIEAVSFEEMQPIVLAQEAAGTLTQAVDDLAGDGEEADDSDAAT